MPAELDKIRWVRVDDNLWQFQQGHVVYSSVLEATDGWHSMSALYHAGPFRDILDAVKAAEAYWQNQDVGPFAEKGDT